MSEKMPKRDVTGKCEGECRDRVGEGEEERQIELKKAGVEAPPHYPNVPGAEKHVNPDNPPAVEKGTNYEIPKQQTAADSGSVTATVVNIVDKGTEVYGKAEQVIGDAYDKTTQKVNETYEKAKSYSGENPGKTILIALGIGVGIGLLLSASSSHRSFTGRIAQPVVNALSEIAQEFLS